jgi:hypothetical protein
MAETTYDAGETLAEMDAGVFIAKVSRALADTALAVIEHDDSRKKGKVTLEFEFERIANSAQVNISHTLKMARPTRRGRATEQDTTATPFYVGARGRLSVMPFAQTDLYKPHQKDTA